MINIKKAFTHNGIFHADDVFSSALLKYLFPEIKIERGDKVPDHYDGIVFDIGGGEYDHHKSNNRIRKNGIQYAAFGLLWEKYGREVLGKAWKQFDKEFVQIIDNTDNTGEKNPLSSIISDMNPLWDEKTDNMLCFNKAVNFAYDILIRRFEKIESFEHGNRMVMERVNDAINPVMVLEQYVPFSKKDIANKIKYIIFPSMRGGYCAEGVGEKFKFPEMMRGKSNDELVKITGDNTLTFCHNSGFLLTGTSESNLISLCKKLCVNENWSI